MLSSFTRRPPTDLADIDAAIRVLHESADRLVALSLDKRVGLVNDCIEAISQIASQWVSEACASKQIPANSSAVAEEILAGPVATLRFLRLLADSLSDMRSAGPPRLPGRIKQADGQLRVPVFPTRSLFDSVLFRPLTAEVWMAEGIAEDEIHGHRLEALRAGTPALTVVLGAGNVSSIPATDALTKVLIENSVVLLKMNPVNDFLGPILERAFQPLISNAFLRIVYGAAAEGAYAVTHAEVDQVHITGSDKTHDMIVWGADRTLHAERKARNHPVLLKSITSELGNVSPWIMVPGRYSKSDLRGQAENIAASITNNASFNCIATKMLLTSRSWPQRAEFLDLLQGVLDSVPTRHPYYPGAHERYARFSEHLGGVEVGPTNDVGHLPWTLIRDSSPAASPHLFREESFVCVCGETSLSVGMPEAFLDEAVRFANDQMWGTLAASVTVPRGFQAARLDTAIGQLRYGVVGINQWPGVAFALMSPPWGAFPGSDLRDVQSGIGCVHNTYLLGPVSKTVLRGPLAMTPKPIWFSTHHHPVSVAWSLLHLYQRPSLGRLPRLLFQAMRG